MIATIVVCLFFAWFVYRQVASIRYHYGIAKSMGIPLIVTPFSWGNPFWLLVRRFFWWLPSLPFGLGSWYVYTEMGWPMIDRTKTHERVGDTFALISPWGVNVVIGHGPAAEVVFGKYKTWLKPVQMGYILDIYGPSVASVNAPDWQRHRKITAPAFNDKNFQLVWQEADKQSEQILRSFFDRKQGAFLMSDVRRVCDTLTMGVLTVVGLGGSAGSEGEQHLAPGHTMTPLEALGTILQNLFMTLLFSSMKLPAFMLPAKIKHLKECVREFGLYMEEAVHQHMTSPKGSQAETNTLMGALVKANDAEQQLQSKDLQSGAKPSFLSVKELYGNLFVFNLAGYDTTSATMTFTLPFLALYPEVQAWVQVEIDTYVTNQPETSYDETFPLLIRTQALMHEVLRIMGPVPQMSRSATTAEELPLDNTGRTIVIPPYTQVSTQFYNIHLDKKRWGADADEFRPSRWMTIDPVTGKETFTGQPPPGAGFMPWLTGPRVCPGKKFSQVEFVASMSRILSEYSVEVLHLPKNKKVKNGPVQNHAEAKAKLLEIIYEVSFSISAHIKRPDEAGVMLRRRNVPAKAQ